MTTSVRHDTVLTLRGIVKTYPGVRALDGVDLTVRAGEVHAVLGENGAGKSTLVGVAAGAVAPDSGTITLLGREHRRLTPALARADGLALVYQTPVLVGSLTVAESMLMLLPERVRPGVDQVAAWTRRHLDELGLPIDAATLVADLTPRQAHLIEIAAALGSEPQVLVLDEPTEALGPDETEWLFEQVRRLVAAGGAVVYITHRIPEIRQIAQRLTVLRDGRVVDSGDVGAQTDEEIVELIVGRSLETTFPPKADLPTADLPTADLPTADLPTADLPTADLPTADLPTADLPTADLPTADLPTAGRTDASSSLLTFDGLTGTGFRGVNGGVHRGEILGLAGVEGNGQRQFLRALAGLVPASGRVAVDGRPVRLTGPAAAARHGIVFLSGERLAEAMFGQLSVRENVAATHLPAVSIGKVLPRRGAERQTVAAAVTSLRVKTATLDSPVGALSGGNQQKALLARAALGEPAVLLVEDPTQGVDAGARVEIYRVLRELAARGTAVVVLSTDAVELEGLCDRVLVFSRGRVQAELAADTLSERHVTGAAVLATEAAVEHGANRTRPPRRRLFGGETQTLAVLAMTVVGAAVTAASSPAFLSLISLQQLLVAAASLALVGLAQLVVVITGGIDLSVGSTVAVAVVVVSFFADGAPAAFAIGIVAAVGAGILVGLINGTLVTAVGLPPVVATLITGIGVLGMAQLLRPLPGGAASGALRTLLGTTIAGVPLTFLVAVAAGVAGHLLLRRSRLGRALRATGSDPVRAARMGVDTIRTKLTGYAIAGALAALGGVVLYAQTGVGNAAVGQALTLASVAAVVLGGASIFGGSGSALATVAAALFLQTVTSAISFLSFSLAWQFWIQGVLVVAAASLPLLRNRRRRRAVVALAAG
ncbi:ribose transport system ATP-binding protein [Micromonospora sp. Llam0]|uniref:ATP-binding cassette domain-containing protein n=1 Tax=Micromonospora sp. Llam0 TaxID=2485143 RepID=UPI000F483F76|nr:ATP-binding cassette domain-containing protein [Micromonospora sp. Llam0]ROO59207.1 ribose transport system ATP-binding protein [Micromonospora sp. Llam0]